MAANRFATMLHKNTNKITLVLIYAVLEWILILLLLLNSLFSHLIIKFAEFFGLKPPCPWCTRIDHVLDPARMNKNPHRDHLCEVHAKEVSGLGYCLNHHNLVEFRDVCEDCLSSSRSDSKNSAFVKEVGMVQNGEEKVGENGEVSLLNCSCCGVNLDNSRYSSYTLLKTSSWDVLECAQKESLITGMMDYDDSLTSNEKVTDFNADLCGGEKVLKDEHENQMLTDTSLEVKEKETEDSGCVSVIVSEPKEMVEEEEKETLMEENSSTMIMKDKSVQVCVLEDVVPVTAITPQHLEFFLDYSGHSLVPIELIDSVAEEHKIEENANIGEEEEDKQKDQEVSLDSQGQVEEQNELVVESKIEGIDTFLDVDINEEPKYPMLESMEMEEDENSLVFHATNSRLMMEFDRAFPLDRWSSGEVIDVQELAEATMEKHSDVHTDDAVCEEEAAQANNENEADVSIGTEIPDLDITDEMQIQDSVQSSHEHPSTSSSSLYELDDHGCNQIEEHMADLPSLSIEDREFTSNNQPSFHETDEEKIPDTPTSVDSLNQLHKKFLMLEKRDSATEESLDGSVTSELDGGDGVVTIERLKSALRAERKALQALYSELEEERNASAVAANQTMAMINRLQEEKAAMQMEALQYQRMMEEQSEYDQEALQLLNELMVKREKEKQELEKELEVYRKKLSDYEMKEKMMRVLKRNGHGSGNKSGSSASCSNGGEESDGLSIDLNQEAKEEEGFYGNQEYGHDQNTPVDAVVNLEESLSDFEEERISILDQLKVLEEKLLTLDDDDHHNKEQDFEDIEKNGSHADGHSNGFSSEVTNGKHHHHQKRRIVGQKGKSLLPLFDATCDENEDVMMNGNGNRNGNVNGFDFNGVNGSYELEFETENKKLAVEEEVDHLYERLQALEADREFLKHCISSLKKGDKGMDLLQEILQHLRDLRNVEIRVRHMGDSDII